MASFVLYSKPEWRQKTQASTTQMSLRSRFEQRREVLKGLGVGSVIKEVVGMCKLYTADPKSEELNKHDHTTDILSHYGGNALNQYSSLSANDIVVMEFDLTNVKGTQLEMMRRQLSQMGTLSHRTVEKVPLIRMKGPYIYLYIERHGARELGVGLWDLCRVSALSQAFDSTPAMALMYDILAALRYMDSHRIHHGALTSDCIFLMPGAPQCYVTGLFGCGHGLITISAERRWTMGMRSAACFPPECILGLMGGNLVTPTGPFSTAKGWRCGSTIPTSLSNDSLTESDDVHDDDDMLATGDLWSVGVLIYEALAGHPLFPHAQTSEDLFSAILQEPIPPLMIPPGDQAVHLIPVIMKLLSRNPQNRGDLSLLISEPAVMRVFSHMRSRRHSSLGSLSGNSLHSFGHLGARAGASISATQVSFFEETQDRNDTTSNLSANEGKFDRDANSEGHTRNPCVSCGKVVAMMYACMTCGENNIFFVLCGNCYVAKRLSHPETHDFLRLSVEGQIVEEFGVNSHQSEVVALEVNEMPGFHLNFADSRHNSSETPEQIPLMRPVSMYCRPHNIVPQPEFTESLQSISVVRPTTTTPLGSARASAIDQMRTSLVGTKSAIGDEEESRLGQCLDLSLSLGINDISETVRSKTLGFLPEEDDSNPEELIDECLAKLSTDLCLSCLSLKVLPGGVLQPPLSHITSLSLSSNQLTCLPDEMEFLVSLEKLVVSENMLTQLPETLGNLGNLTNLDASRNFLSSLPQSLMFCDHLDKLSLDQNKFCCFPDVLHDIASLTTVYLALNPGLIHWPARDVIVVRDTPLLIGIDNVPELVATAGPHLTEAGFKIEWNKIYPDMIIPNLYCGSLRSTQSQMVYDKLGITFLLTMGRGLEPIPPVCGTHKVVIVDDIEGADIAFAFEEAVKFIDDALTRNKGCLVHCFAGMSRSATAVVAYLMIYKKMRLDDAYCCAKRGRPAIYPNDGFFKQLLALDARLYPKERPLDLSSMDRGNIPM